MCLSAAANGGSAPGTMPAKRPRAGGSAGTTLALIAARLAQRRPHSSSLNPANTALKVTPRHPGGSTLQGATPDAIMLPCLQGNRGYRPVPGCYRALFGRLYTG